jgi:ribonucleoside-diphosphate reductase alpha chain
MKKMVLPKKSGGGQETPAEAYRRVAKFVATGHEIFEGKEKAEKFADKAEEYMSEGKFMPNTPTLVNAGFPHAQCSACFVVPVEDNLPSIYKAHHDQGLIQASGGGTGFYLGNIRSAGTLARDRLVTRGPISWLKMLNENAGHVAQGTRHGANMAILNIGHPDIIDFINCKKSGYNTQIEDLMEQFGLSHDEAVRLRSVIGVEKFNLSVAISDKFIETLRRGGDWYLSDPHTKQRTKTLPAKDLWNLIIKNAHEHGEPGIFFVDTANKSNPLSHIARIVSTNPCGEKPMIPYGSCNLGHVNLSKFVCGTNGSSKINWDGLEETIRFAVRFLDNIVEINTFPIEELASVNKNSRQIGVGVMGWADMLIRLGIAYDSQGAIDLANDVGSFLDKTTFNESERLGRDRGDYPWFANSPLQKSGQTHMRNSERTTIAPTGQSAMYAGSCSYGIEPNMFPVMRREQAGMVQVDYHPLLFKVLDERGLNTQEIKDKLGILGSARKATFLPEDIQRLFPSAHDIHYEWHIKHQAAWQKHITSAVSKTINLPKEATAADVDAAYLMAYDLGCKGITVYRDGSRMNQPISSLKTNEKKLVQLKHKRSEVTHGTNRKVPTGCGNLMVYVGESDGHIEEITARLGKGGGCAAAQTEAIARMASIAMQHGAEPAYIAKQLSGVRCHLSALHRSKYTGDRPRTVTSCADAMSVALSEHLSNGSGKKIDAPDKTSGHTGACPDCGGQLAFEEGCNKCYNCGFSRCG